MRSRAMQQLTNEMSARYPGMTIYGKGDAAHALRTSDHNEDDTAGVQAAQSDADNVPEHRAIDAMLGSVFTRPEARKVISECLASAEDRKKLRYINFENTQWHRNNNFEPHDNSDDPHPDHVHFSQQASEDDNTSRWFASSTGEEDMFAAHGMGENGTPINHHAMYLQEGMLGLIDPNDTRLAEHPLTIDGKYGNNTAYWVSILLTGGDGKMVDGKWFRRLDRMLSSVDAAGAIVEHVEHEQHGTVDLPESIEFTIPAQTISAPLS